MTDKELLKLAAKAMGRKIKTKFYEADGWCARWHHVISKDIDEWCDWNPHTDNADAFELAVKLGIDLEWRNDGRVAAYIHANANGYCFTALESTRKDRYAAARRAILLVAAEIGRGME